MFDRVFIERCGQKREAAHIGHHRRVNELERIWPLAKLIQKTLVYLLSDIFV
jgi:hypothetical protein